ncbi:MULTISPECIES: effector protein NopP [Microvirga]|uniref:effector protein NopP n=1 Tax=Microvirga TaxID=186650 RepID=UPI00273A1039|nr:MULTISPECIES: effector protein NopP [unclassified Microvirga]
MYGRIGGISDEWKRNGLADETDSWAADGEQTQSFSDTFANMHLAAADSSARSSSPAPAYSLVPKPPVLEIDKFTFREEAKAFHSKEIEDIANNPQEYSNFISTRAKNAAEIAKKYGTTTDTEQARYFSYKLGRKTVALLRTEGGCPMDDFEGEKWRELFPGRTEITSTVDLQVAHPLVENAGDILLEYQLRRDGERPLLLSRPGNAEAKARAAKMGFVEVDNCNMVLDPTQHPDKWTTNSAGEWLRVNRPQQFLSKIEESEGGDNPIASSGYAYEDDFM